MTKALLTGIAALAVSVLVTACNQDKGKEITKEQEEKLAQMEKTSLEVRKQTAENEKASANLVKQIQAFVELKRKTEQAKADVGDGLSPENQAKIVAAEDLAQKLALAEEKLLAQAATLKDLKEPSDTDLHFKGLLADLPPGEGIPSQVYVVAPLESDFTAIKSRISDLRARHNEKIVGESLDSVDRESLNADDRIGKFLVSIRSHEELQSLKSTINKNAVVVVYPIQRMRVRTHLALHYSNNKNLQFFVTEDMLPNAKDLKSLVDSARKGGKVVKLCEKVDVPCIKAISPMLNRQEDIRGVKQNLKEAIIKLLDQSKFEFLMGKSASASEGYITGLMLSNELWFEGPATSDISLFSVPDKEKDKFAAQANNAWLKISAPAPYQATQILVQTNIDYINDIDVLKESLR